MDHTSGMFGRSADFMNFMVTALAMCWQDFQRGERPYGTYLRDYYEEIRERDLVLTHTLLLLYLASTVPQTILQCQKYVSFCSQNHLLEKAHICSYKIISNQSILHAQYHPPYSDSLQS